MLILNFYGAKYFEAMADFFLRFSENPSNFKKLSEMDVPAIYQYYKDRVKYSQNEFKEMYKIMSNRNDKCFNVVKRICPAQ
jgi:hypothetical protein